jgi:hypothetical protein
VAVLGSRGGITQARDISFIYCEEPLEKGGNPEVPYMAVVRGTGSYL